jgi:hypothetical protein
MEQWRGKLVVLSFLCYFLLLSPYIIHTNLFEVDAGVIDDLKTIPPQSLPGDIQDVATFNDTCTLLLVEDSVSGIKTVVIIERLPHSLYVGDVIEVTDKIIKWYVDWHAYAFFDKRFNLIIVGDVEEISIIESFVERVLYSRLGIPLFSLSKIVFFLAPPILIIFSSFFLRKRLFFLFKKTSLFVEHHCIFSTLFFTSFPFLHSGEFAPHSDFHALKIFWLFLLLFYPFLAFLHEIRRK